ncbi:MAG: hypothetical protein ACE5IR_13730 [bacterium]
MTVKQDISEILQINLKGIWKNKGFEKIADLDSELKSIQGELSESILKKGTQV